MKVKHVRRSSCVLALVLVAGCATENPRQAAISPAVTQAIDNARAAIEMAEANHWIWRDTEMLVQRAEASAQKGDDVTAIKYANKARVQAELAVNQYYLENSRFLLQRAQARHGSSTAQQQALKAAAAAIRGAKGQQAYDLLVNMHQE